MPPSASKASKGSPAPKGRKTLARGNAPGSASPTNPSPEGAAHRWPVVPLGEIAVSMKNGLYKPASAYADDGIPCLRMYNIEDGKIVWKDIKRMRLTSAEAEDYGLLPGDLLVNRVNSRELVGKTAPIPDALGPCVFESKNIRVRLDRDRVDPKWVSYKLLLDGSRYFDRNAQQVVGMASINQGQLGNFPIPLPPLPEQRRIVARIEELFSRLDAGVAALRHAKAQLQRYRQSVLAAAVTGQLTQAWREQHPDTEPAIELLERILQLHQQRWSGSGKYHEPSPPEHSELPDLPEGWVWTSMEQLGLVIGGLTKNSKRNALPTQLPYLRVANVYADELRLDEIKEIGVADSELEKLLVRKGDLLVVEGNGSKDQIGRLAIWDGSIDPCVHQNHLIKVRLHEPDLGKFVMAWMLSPSGRPHIERVASSTSGLYTLSVGKVAKLPVPLPPLAEQPQIVAEVEARTTAIDHLEAEIDRQITRSNRLRQSTLAAAFSGQL